MKRRPTSTLFLSVLLASLLVGCASTEKKSGDMGDAAKVAAEDQEAEREIQDLEQKLEIARARLEIAQLEQKSYEDELAGRLRHAQTELELATARLERFRESDAPNRVARERLDLVSVKDRAQEAADELKQIEIMYADQDLDDVTAEFVVSRGRRQAERAKQRIEIQEASFRSLEEREIPEDEKRMMLDVDRAKSSLAAAEREGEIGRRRQAISVKEAELAVEKAERELADKRKEQA